MVNIMKFSLLMISLCGCATETMDTAIVGCGDICEGSIDRLQQK